MPHKLLIAAELIGEPVRGNQIGVKLKVENIGDQDFEGKFDRIRLEFPQSVTELVPSLLPALPVLKKGVPTTVGPVPFMLSDDGHSWLTVYITSNDGQPIGYCQNREGPPLPEKRWLYPLYITRSEDAQIIALLNEIAELLRGRSLG